MVSREIHAQPIHIEELYNQGHQVAALTEEYESQEPLQYFKVKIILHGSSKKFINIRDWVTGVDTVRNYFII